MAASVYSQFNNPWSKMVRICCLSLWMVLYSVPLWSFDFPENLQFHGFASQGYNWTSNNNFFGHSQDKGSFDYTEIGANASWLPLNNLQLSGQLLFRRAGETDPQSLRLDYGLLDYTVLSDEANRWGIRIGRVKNPTGFYNETRDVFFTRPSILLPQSIYPDYVRSLALSSDGFYIYGERHSDYGDLFLQSGIGYPDAINRELEPASFYYRVPGNFNSDLSYISRLLYEWHGGEIRTAITYFQANYHYNSGNSPSFPVPGGSLRIEPWILSLQYNAERWSLTTEYSLLTTRTNGLGQSSNINTAEAYYFQGTYRILKDWEALLRYDLTYANKNDKNGHEFAAKDPLGLPAYSRYAKDWTIGLRWNVTTQFSLGIENHWVNGTAWLPPLDNPNPYDTNRHWDLLLFMGSYRF